MVYSIDNWTTSKEVVGKFTHNDIEHEVWEFDAVVKGKTNVLPRITFGRRTLS